MPVRKPQKNGKTKEEQEEKEGREEEGMEHPCKYQ
jgi:hypothetical protein